MTNGNRRNILEEGMSANRPHAHYNRAPSDAMKALLSSDGFLAPLTELNGKSPQTLPLDVQLRREDEVHVYCGLTRILRVRRNRNGTVTASADRSYSNQECAEAVMGRWDSQEPQKFGTALETYVSQVDVQERHTEQEGRMQAAWSLIREPWTPFDKEAVLAYTTTEESERARDIPQVHLARRELEQTVGWTVPEPGGREVDQLAVDGEGRLVLVELKSARATPAAIYLAPLQLLQYVWEWRQALDCVNGQLQELIGARLELGLTRGPIPPLNGELRAAVCLDHEPESQEVRNRYQQVLEAVNRHLPDNMPAIETWTEDDVPAIAQSPGRQAASLAISPGGSFAASIQGHMEEWRRETTGTVGRMWERWTDGIHPQYRDLAEQVVSTDLVKLHQYAAHLRSSQAFAFNLFLPFRQGNREALSHRVSQHIGTLISVDEIRFEWVPPGALLGEIEGDTPAGGEPATAADVVLWGILPDGNRCAVLLEVKLSETGFTHCGGRTSSNNTRKDVCASAALFFQDPGNCYLRRTLGQNRDRRYWDIFAASHGSVRAAFPGADSGGYCPFAYDMQQPMRNLAIARGLEQDRDSGVDIAWFGLCAHDGNGQAAGHWKEWRSLLPEGTPAPYIPASDIVSAGETAGHTDWAGWMRARYRL